METTYTQPFINQTTPALISMTGEPAGGVGCHRADGPKTDHALTFILDHSMGADHTVQDIVGHERSTLTGSTYSGKSTFEMRCIAIKQLVFDTKY